MNSCLNFLSCLSLGHSFLCVCVVWMCGHTCVERTEDILNDVLRTPFIWTIFEGSLTLTWR